ncbi:hypothetical protein ALC62_08708, partial [Cyphomyrmex costatus]
IKISCVNINSIRAHFQDVEAELSDCSTHILALTETWLTPNVDSSCIAIPNYNFVQNDREILADSQLRFLQGGGVACYLHKSLCYTILECSNNTNINSPEYLFVSIKSSTQNLLLIIVYRQPHGLLFSEFLNKLNLYVSTYSNIVITGDLNCDLLTDNFESKYLSDFLNDYSFFSVPYGPTHYSTHSHSQLDVVIVDSSDKIHNFSKSSVPFAAGHCLVTVYYQFSNLNKIPHNITYRNFVNCNHTSLANDLSSLLSVKLSKPPLATIIHRSQ